MAINHSLLSGSARHFLAVTFRADLSVLNLWIDGQHISYQQVPIHSLIGNALSVEIGRNGLATGKYWLGKLQDVPDLQPGRRPASLARSPEMGGTLSPKAEPGRTILPVAGQLEGLPHRFGAHPLGVHACPSTGRAPCAGCRPIGSAPTAMLVSAQDKADMESLDVRRLDIITSALMPTSFDATAVSGDETAQAAWRMIEASDTRCISQVESPGF